MAHAFEQALVPSTEKKGERGGEISERALVVRECRPGSAAEKAGLRQGDRIVSVGGEPVEKDWQQLSRLLREHQGVLSVRVRRADGETDVPLDAVQDAETGDWRIGLVYDLRERIKRPGDAEPVEFENRRFVMQDAEGNEMASVEMDVAEPREGEPLREIRSYVLHGMRPDGTEVSFDVLGRFNHHGVPVFWNPDLEYGAGMFNPNSKTVFIRNPFNPAALHVLLHELRHAYQNAQDLFGPLEYHYLDVDSQEEGLMDSVLHAKEDLSWAREILIRVLSDEEADTVLKPLADWQKKHVKGIDALRRSAREDRMEEQHGSFDPALQREWLSLPIIGRATLRDVFAYPRLVIERDAEYGALVALRTIGDETGIDVLRTPLPSGRSGMSLSPEERDDARAALERRLAFMEDETSKEKERQSFDEWLQSEDVAETRLQSVDVMLQDIGLDKGCFHDIRRAALRAEKRNRPSQAEAA